MHRVVEEKKRSTSPEGLPIGGGVLGSSKRSKLSNSRTSASCLSCRRKKIKCDKEHPCGNCKEPSDCEYESVKWINTTLAKEGSLVKESPISSTKSMDSPDSGSSNRSGSNSIYVELLEKELVSLKMQISTLTKAHDTLQLLARLNDADTMSLYDDYDSLQLTQGQVTYHGPFNWCTLIKRDRNLKLTWYALLSTQIKLMNKALHSTSKEKSVTFTPVFAPSELRGSFYDQKVSQFEKQEQKYFLTSKKLNLHPNHTLTRFNIDHGNGFVEPTVKSYILALMPKKKVVWLSIDRFFKYCYSFVPVIDEYDFKADIFKIIGGRSVEDVKYDSLNLQRDTDLAIMGSLLLVVILGSKTLTGINEQALSEDEKYLLLNQLSYEVTRMANKCVFEFQSNLSNNLSSLQNLLLVSLLERFAPESTDFCNSRSKLLNGHMMQIAMALGINRNPSGYNLRTPTEQRRLNMIRKIWCKIRSCDFEQNYLTGYPSAVLLDYEDGVLPERPTSLNKNTESFLIDVKAYEMITRNIAVEEQMVKILRNICQLNSRPKTLDMMQYLEQMDRVVETSFDKIENLLAKRTEQTGELELVFNMEKVFEVYSYFAFSSIPYMIRYHIFLHYDLMGDAEQSFKFLKRIYEGSCEYFESLNLIIDKPFEIFGNGFLYGIIPILELSLQKHKMVDCTIANRLIVLRSQYLLKGGDFSSLEPLVRNCIKTCADRFYSGLAPWNKLSDKYYYSWKVSKAHFIIYSQLYADLDKSDYPIMIVRDKKTGDKRLLARWDSLEYNLSTPVDFTSFMTEYDVEDFERLFEMMAEANALVNKKFQQVQKPVLPNRDPNSITELLSALQIDSIWKDLFDKDYSFENYEALSPFFQDDPDFEGRLNYTSFPAEPTLNTFDWNFYLKDLGLDGQTDPSASRSM